MVATETATLDTGQVAALLQCSVRHVSNLVKRGQFIEPIRLGALVRWDRESVARWLAERSRTTVNRGGREVQTRG